MAVLASLLACSTRAMFRALAARSGELNLGRRFRLSLAREVRLGGGDGEDSELDPWASLSSSLDPPSPPEGVLEGDRDLDSRFTFFLVSDSSSPFDRERFLVSSLASLPRPILYVNC